MTDAPPGPRVLRTSGAVGLVMMVPAVAAWVFGSTFIFPSLGPSAYYLVVTRERGHLMRHVVGGHFIGLICGYIAYHLLVHHGALKAVDLAPFSQEGLRLALSGVLAVIATTALMRWLRSMSHPPACSTALIAALGLLPTLKDASFIMISVVVMAVGYRLLLHPERAS